MAIRQNAESPSAATRSGAPKGELEQYGVWVKAEPQDIVEEAAFPPMDLDLPAEAPKTGGDTFLSADEEKLLGDFDADFDLPKADEPLSLDSSSLPSMDDIPALDESLLDAAPSPSSDEIEDLGSATVDISLDELEGQRSSTSSTDASIEIGDLDGLSAADAHIPSPIMEDVSADFMDAEPAKGESPVTDDVTAEFLDLEAPSSEHPEAKAHSAHEPTAAASSDFESIDLDLHFDETLPQIEENTSKSSTIPGFEPVTEFDDFLTTEQIKPAEPTFDDVAAVEQDLASGPTPSLDTPSAKSPPPPSADLSTEILLKIADELSSIRGELVSLKAQLGDLKREAEVVAKAEPESAAENEDEEGQAGGFFDEEEDETIALTGDELDNILNTADFTEEVVTEEGVDALSEAEAFEEPSSLSLDQAPDTSILDESILPESGDYSAAPEDQPAIEEINLDAQGSLATVPLEEEAPPEESDLAEIGLLAEEGVQPITEAPDDTSYLEAELSIGEQAAEEGGSGSEAASAEADLGRIPLSDVPLVEPDLSAFDTEELEAEPIPEIEEELPLVEESEILPDISLSAEEIMEAESIEPSFDADQSHLSGIDLHEESGAEILPEIEEIPEADMALAGSEPSILEEKIELGTVKPAEPVALHPDEVPSQLDDALFVEESAPAAPPSPAPMPAEDDTDRLKSEIRSVLSYLDKLLDSLPEDKIEEFARSEHFDTYKKLFEELGLV